MSLRVTLQRAAGVFLLMVGSDWFWAQYTAAIAEHHSIAASNWAVAIIIFGAFITSAYVKDRRMIVPAALGAWLGTYLSLIWTLA